jgi:hypothetical protein
MLMAGRFLAQPFVAPIFPVLCPFAAIAIARLLVFGGGLKARR